MKAIFNSLGINTALLLQVGIKNALESLTLYCASGASKDE